MDFNTRRLLIDKARADFPKLTMTDDQAYELASTGSVMIPPTDEAVEAYADYMRSLHYGAAYARYLLVIGEIDGEEAKKRIDASRLKRRKSSSMARLAKSVKLNP